MPSPATVRQPSLEEQFRARYCAATGRDWVHRGQVEGTTALLRRLANAALRGDGLTVHRTWRQFARGLGLADERTTVDEVETRFRGTLRNRLRYLELTGFVESWEAIYDGRGESTGILVRLPAGVAQSVRATPSARPQGMPPRRPGCVRMPPPTGASATLPRAPAPRAGPECSDFSLCGEINRPRRGLVVTSPSPSTSSTAQRGACTRESAEAARCVRAALVERRELLGEEGGAAIVAALPWLALVAPAVLAREACRVAMPSLTDLRLSMLWEGRLDAAVVQIDRCAGRPGAGAELLLDLITEDGGRPDPLLLELLGGEKPRRDRKPRTLGAIAVAARRWARRQRAGWRAGARPGGQPA